MKKKQLQASGLRILLVLALIGEVALAIALFSYSYTILHTQAELVSQKKAEAEASSSSLDQLQTIQKQLDTNKEVPELVQSLFASGDLPQFKAVSNIQAIAAEQGVPIGNITFVDSSSIPAAGTATPTTGTTPPATSASSSASVAISFSITSAIPYETFLNFLNAIELNRPKLQIDGVTLPAGSSRASVDPGIITVKMFLQ